MRPHVTEGQGSEDELSSHKEESMQAAGPNGAAIDDVILEAVGHRDEAITMPALVNEVHSKDVNVGEMEVRYAVWRLIDRGRIVLDRDRRIRTSA
jgi:DNA-binding transcriptional regulator PaaX